MDVTKKLVTERYKALNKKIFKGELPMPSKISVGRQTLAAGQFWSSKGNKDSRTEIVISNCFDYTEETLDETIAHEMVHFLIYLGGKKDSSAHGKLFKAECKRIHDEFGITIHKNAKHIKLLDDKKQKIPRTERIIYWVFWPLNYLRNLIWP